MIGLMANAARHEPDAVAALRAGRDDRMNRLLRLPLPEPYLPSRVDALRDRLRTRGDAPAARPAKPVKPVKPVKPAKPAKAPAQTAKRRTAPAETRRSGHRGGTARRAGHDGGAAEQRRVATAQGRGRPTTIEHGDRRSRAMEGQRYG